MDPALVGESAAQVGGERRTMKGGEVAIIEPRDGEGIAVTLVFQHHDYYYRWPHFGQYNIAEYSALVLRKKKTATANITGITVHELLGKAQSNGYGASRRTDHT